MFVQKWSNRVNRMLVRMIVPHSMSEAPSSELLTRAAEKGNGLSSSLCSFLNAGEWASGEPSQEVLMSFRQTWSMMYMRD